MSVKEVGKVLKRLKLYAQAVGVEVPRPIINEDGGPSSEVIDFCEKHGASLDYIYTGDVTPLIHAVASKPKEFDETDFRDAHNAVDYHLTTTIGLACALYDIGREADGICNPTDEGMALMGLITTIKERLEAIADLRQSEWDAIIQPRQNAFAE
ncbi:hypothetical protein [Psychromarinibacter sp. S121]|uniref:hypothetical protein n=1 Tax=Psychromarinibacter sp. S121 TaxID=3415127 RepID=UPI003C7B2DC9